MGGYQALSGAVSQLFVGVAYVFVCLKALGGAFGVGAIVQYVSAITALSSGLSVLIETLGNLKNNTPFLCTVFEFLDMPNKMDQGDMDINHNSKNKDEIEFRNVFLNIPVRKIMHCVMCLLRSMQDKEWL